MRTENTCRRKAGFTIAEMLIAVLILLMVSAVLAAGVPVAVNAYNKVIDAANAQLLLSTTVTRMEEELSTAVEVWTEESKLTSYSHYRNGYKISPSNVEPELPAGSTETLTGKKGIWLKYTARATGMWIPKNELLVTGKTETEKFYVSFESITYEDNVFYVKNLKVLKIDGTESSVKPVDLKIRPVKQPVLNPAV